MLLILGICRVDDIQKFGVLPMVVLIPSAIFIDSCFIYYDIGKVYKIKHTLRINILVGLKYKTNKEVFEIDSIF